MEQALFEPAAASPVGAALFAGAGGSILFAAIGLVVAIPFLLRLRRRADGWGVPSAVLAAMALIFSISTFVTGPKIAGGEDGSPDVQAAPAKTAPAATPAPAGGEAPAQSGHEAHH